MQDPAYFIPVATREEIQAGYDGVAVDPHTGDLYLVPVDPASGLETDCCQ